MKRTGLAGEIPLMSREAEVDRILAGLRQPRPAAFVLTGAAGVGKTRLAAAAAQSAAKLGFSVAQAVATRASTPIPFGPFAPFLPSAGQSAQDLLGLLKTRSRPVAGFGTPQPGIWSSPPINPQVSHLCPVLEPHRLQQPIPTSRKSPGFPSFL